MIMYEGAAERGVYTISWQKIVQITLKTTCCLLFPEFKFSSAGHWLDESVVNRLVKEF
jgi:hypothetical protein